MMMVLPYNMHVFWTEQSLKKFSGDRKTLFNILIKKLLSPLNLTFFGIKNSFQSSFFCEHGENYDT